VPAVPGRLQRVQRRGEGPAEGRGGVNMLVTGVKAWAATVVACAVVWAGATVAARVLDKRESSKVL
jgi:hypothetical protein